MLYYKATAGCGVLGCAVRCAFGRCEVLANFLAHVGGWLTAVKPLPESENPGWRVGGAPNKMAFIVYCYSLITKLYKPRHP